MFEFQEGWWDRPLNGKDTTNEMPHALGTFLYGVCHSICRVAWRYTVDGKENLTGFKGHSGVIVVAPHTSFLDVVFMFCSCRPEVWVRFIGRDSLFPKAGGLLGLALSSVGAFPIKRDSADRTCIKRAVRNLKNQEVVGILPEGTRRGKSDRKPELHAGAALIAKMAGDVPLLPMCVREAENVKRKGERLRFPHVSVEFGNPVLLSDFDFLPKADRQLGCTWYVMRECFALKYRCEPQDVDMVALFPDGKDFTEVFATHEVPAHTTPEVVALKDELRKQAEAAAEARTAQETAQETAPNSMNTKGE